MPFLVDDDLHVIRIPDGFRVGEFPHQRDHVGVPFACRVQGTFDDLGLDQWLVALNVDDDRVIGQLGGHLRQPVGTASMVGPGQDHIAAKILDGLLYAVVVGSHHDAV